VLDYVRPNTLLLAEACQPPKEVVKYFGEGDECHAGYHFPLMPMIFKALAVNDASPIHEVLHPSVTPEIAPENQWFMFLRLHDELTLEMVTPEDRAIIHGHYCKDPRWDFRVGEGISARLAELLDRDPRKIALAYSIMLTLPGTPIIYYGDEFAKLNNEAFYESFKLETGKDDTRYFVRGPLDWALAASELAVKDSLTATVYKTITEQLKVRGQWQVFGRGDCEWATLEISPRENHEKPLLAYFRSMPGQRVLVINNLSDKEITIKAIDDNNLDFVNLANNKPVEAPFTLPPYGYLWLEA